MATNEMTYQQRRDLKILDELVAVRLKKLTPGEIARLPTAELRELAIRVCFKVPRPCAYSRDDGH